MIQDNIKIGDIFVCSWGYDQTNIDFYQVIARTEKMVTVRRIQAKHEAAHTMANYVTPLKDKFLDSDHPFDQAYGKPMKKRLQTFSNGEIYFRTASYATARLLDGQRRTETYTG